MEQNISDKDFLKRPRLRKDKDQLIKAVNSDFYKFYKKKYKESCVKDNKKIREVLKSFHKNIQEVTKDNRDGCRLLFLGKIITVSCDPSITFLKKDNFLINHKLSNTLDKKVKYNNLETDGKICKIFFSFRIKESKLPYKNAWSFRACRDFKKIVSKSFLENHTKYIDIKSLRLLKTS